MSCLALVALLMLSIVDMLGFSLSTWAQESNPRQEQKPGLAIGEKIPQFQAVDQNGALRDFASIRGPKGVVIYFHRSASW